MKPKKLYPVCTRCGSTSRDATKPVCAQCLHDEQLAHELDADDDR